MKLDLTNARALYEIAATLKTALLFEALTLRLLFEKRTLIVS